MARTRAQGPRAGGGRHAGETAWRFLETLDGELPYNPATPRLRVYLQDVKPRVTKASARALTAVCSSLLGAGTGGHPGVPDGRMGKGDAQPWNSTRPRERRKSWHLSQLA